MIKMIWATTIFLHIDNLGCRDIGDLFVRLPGRNVPNVIVAIAGYPRPVIRERLFYFGSQFVEKFTSVGGNQRIANAEPPDLNNFSRLILVARQVHLVITRAVELRVALGCIRSGRAIKPCFSGVCAERFAQALAIRQGFA